MDKFLVNFNKYTKNKYNYLRLKKVEFFEYEKVAKLYFAIPEDIYENGFDNTVIAELKKYCAKVAPNYKCEFYFERLFISEDIVNEYLLEMLATNYPFLAATINKDCVSVAISNRIDIEIKIEEDVFELIDGAPFVKDIISNVEENFGFETFLTFRLVEIGEIKVEQTHNQIVSKKTVRVANVEFLCGVNSKYIQNPLFIDSLNRPIETVAVCGVVKSNEKRVFEKDPNSRFKYFRYNYRIKISDFSGELTGYFKTNDDYCKLENVKEGAEVLLQGRLAYSDRLGKYVLYIKTICVVDLDKNKIQDMLKPHPIPTELKFPATKYQGMDFLVAQTLFDLETQNEPNKEMNCVFMTYKSVTKGFSPWEICLLKFTEGKADTVYQRFVKVSALERVDIEYKAKVMAAKRLADIVPDILCFCNGYTLYCKNIEEVQKEIKSIAKIQHMECVLDMQEADKLGTKNGQKFDPTFERLLKEYGIVVNGDRCYDYAIAMAKLYLKVKK